MKYLKIHTLLFVVAIVASCSEKTNEDLVPLVTEEVKEEPSQNETSEKETPKEDPVEEQPKIVLGQDASIPSFLEGENPNKSTQTWTKVEFLSDEFEATDLDDQKWGELGTGWKGREPGIFKADAIHMLDGNMTITNYKLDQPEGAYTHAGSLVRSKNTAKPGMYLECRMKASKTFMSSTFWLINSRGEGKGCDKRTIELDIQETVGRITEKTASFAKTHDAGMFSNTHSRNTSCSETGTGSVKSSIKTDFKCWEDYHIYACWWKSPTEILFFLDGKLVNTVTPAEKFNLPMYLRMVTETYNWNPVPSDGGLTGTKEERTTYYDWVRTWELK